MPFEDADQAPEGFPIKGDEGELHEVPRPRRWVGSPTTAEVWFDTEESAQAAGFEKAGE